MKEDQSERRFRRFGMITITAVFLLIFVGGLVRSTGSGMGCPDWPKCFGQWIPPTEVNQLPSNYKEIFQVQGHNIADFDPIKTWIEYVNRLIGVLIGFFIFLTMFFAIPYLKKDKTIFFLSFLAFVLVGFQGWIGSKVVSTNLSHWMITIHMMIALVIVALLIYTITRSQSFSIHQLQADNSFKSVVYLLLVLGVVQTVVGTQIRESVDIIERLTQGARREKWINWILNGELNELYDFSVYRLAFLFHRTSSLITFALTAWATWKAKNLFDRNAILYKILLGIIVLVALQIFGGKVLEVYGLPKYVQSLHLFIGSLIMGGYIFMTILVKTKIELRHKD
jgi:cytochrome c oxidase assembly protein subunit 15